LLLKSLLNSHDIAEEDEKKYRLTQSLDKAAESHNREIKPEEFEHEGHITLERKIHIALG
jgi:hypothetical protein